MEDVTMTIMFGYVGVSSVVSQLQRLRNTEGSLSPAARYAWLAQSITGVVFIVYVVAGGSVKLDISPAIAHALRLLAFAMLAAGFCLSLVWTSNRGAPADLTPPAHPSRTPPAP